MTDQQPDGFLAVPPAGQGRPVLVLHPWWGLNATIEGICTRLAEEGFLAFAPDMYHGPVTDQIPEADRLSRALLSDFDQPRADLAQAVAFLSARAGHTDQGMAAIGFSLGALFALDLSITAPETVQTVVVFYGTHPGDFANSKAAYLGHFAETDQFEARSDVVALEEALQRAGRPVTFYQYEGTEHWFFEPDRVQAYKASAAHLAWERTLAFLKRSAT